MNVFNLNETTDFFYVRLLLERSQQRGGSTRLPTRESQTESSETETETESETGSESYDKENEPVTVDTVTVLPRKGAQGQAKERVKGGQSGAKVPPAGAVRVLPEDGRGRRKGSDRQGGEKDKGGGGEEITGEEESSWDR